MGDAKDPKLRSLLESGGPADTTGSWSPDYTPEVKAALKFFIDSYNTVELGGMELLQAKQIPNAYIADTPEVAAAKEAFMAAFEAAEMGKHAEMVPVNNDIPVKMAQPVIYHQPLVHYQIPHYLPTTYNLFGR